MTQNISIHLDNKGHPHMPFASIKKTQKKWKCTRKPPLQVGTLIWQLWILWQKAEIARIALHWCIWLYGYMDVYHPLHLSCSVSEWNCAKTMDCDETSKQYVCVTIKKMSLDFTGLHELAVWCRNLKTSAQ